MSFLIAAHTDIGIARPSNQDSVCMKRAVLDGDEIVMAIICDGMGGFEKGELASAEIIHFFSKWFDELPVYQVISDWNGIMELWIGYLERLNKKIRRYGEQSHIKLGSTFSGILLWKNRYLLVHIGDTRIYQITDQVRLLTTDHILPQRQNVLTQCIGAGRPLYPELRTGTYAEDTFFLLCSDGFRHRIKEEEIKKWFSNSPLRTKEEMEMRCAQVVELLKKRGEKDNITVALIKKV